MILVYDTGGNEAYDEVDATVEASGITSESTTSQSKSPTSSSEEKSNDSPSPLFFWETVIMLFVIGVIADVSE